MTCIRPSGRITWAGRSSRWGGPSRPRRRSRRRCPATAVDQGGVIHATRALLRAKTGDRRGAEADIAAAIEAGKGFGYFHHTALTIGEVYATLGDVERAHEWVERASNDGFPCYAFFEVDPHLAPLRATERFRRFLTQLRAEWESIEP